MVLLRTKSSNTGPIVKVSSRNKFLLLIELNFPSHLSGLVSPKKFQLQMIFMIFLHLRFARGKDRTTFNEALSFRAQIVQFTVVLAFMPVIFDAWGMYN